MNTNYDAIVVGLGGMGSAAAYHLAERGCRILGLDANMPGHTNGSSHGQTRMIRAAHPEGDAYFLLARRAYALWKSLAHASGEDLLTVTGGLAIGLPDSEHVRGRVSSARRHAMDYELLDAAQLSARYPLFRIPDGYVAFYDPLAGFLRPRNCIEAHLKLAASRGATLTHGEAVLSWKPEGDGVRVTTSRHTYSASRLVVTTGAWSPEFLAELGLPWNVERIVNAHFESLRPALSDAGHCPVYQLDVPEGYFYGFPMLDGEGMKLGVHKGDRFCTPQTIDRNIGEAEVAELADVFNRYMPGAIGAVRQALTCMYTNTPDGLMAIGRHPRYRQVAYAGGDSGKGFKFTSVIGEILADLTLTGTTHHPIQALSGERFH
ncbi:N-methyl-L-tryptophan oxidase [Paraburkholderia sp.]|uniref:N-methyl-L-tryptophan oxidase n=1 Tax=Paraburkholderia sp. TaxID=1926495 RepID=UPI0039E70CC0